MPAKDKNIIPIHHVRLFLKILGAIVVVFGGISLLAVLVTIINNPDTTGPVYLALININLIFGVGLLVFMGRRLVLWFMDRRSRMASPKLHYRLLGIFSVLAVMPAIIVSVFSVFLLNQGIEAWFSSKVTEALEGSRLVAQAYLEEHENRLKLEAESIAKDSRVKDALFLLERERLEENLAREMDRRNLVELTLYHKDGSVVAHAGDFTPSPPSAAILETISSNTNETFTYLDLDEKRIQAAAQVEDNIWLVVTRWLSPAVLARVDQTHEAFQEYFDLRKDREDIKIIFTLFLFLLAAASLGGAIWAGLRVANKIVRPVTDLVQATNKVSAGDFEVRVDPQDDDEIGILTQSFNRMARQLRDNRSLLERKNRELDDRRRIIEAVLTGVTAGVISADAKGKVNISNRTAQRRFNIETGDKLAKKSPELTALFDKLSQSSLNLLQEQMRIEEDGEGRTLIVRLVAQRSARGAIQSVVITFDDITELLSAQRVAAWSDVARNLAHEIKNPLTPIQLSAERLRRKYGKEIKTDPELFEKLTDTISSQVEDMRAMLNEFSDFARMPAPQFGEENLVELIKDALVLQQGGRGEIEYETDFKVKDANLVCDRAQVHRVLTNVLENAANAILEDPEHEKKGKGHIKIVVKMSQDDTLIASVSDNGRGLPEDVEVEHLFDPYVTTRKRGTGLGLAIVRKVMDEHGGQIRLTRRKEGGTLVELTFPTTPKDTA